MSIERKIRLCNKKDLRKIRSSQALEAELELSLVTAWRIQWKCWTTVSLNFEFRKGKSETGIVRWKQRIDFKYLNLFLIYIKFKFYVNKKLLYWVNTFACLKLQFVTWLHHYYIFQHSYLFHLIRQKILHEFNKIQFNWTIFTGFMVISNFAQILIYINLFKK